MKYRKIEHWSNSQKDGYYIRKYCYGYRHPKTFQEMKWADKYTRQCRKKLPTNWDDKHISRGVVRSWKDRSKKCKQYMPD